MLLLWLAAAIAAGAPAVQWTAPLQCPDAATAERTIAAGLSAESDLRVHANVREESEQFVADVEVSGPAGETRRTLESPECATLVDAVALIAQAAEEEAEEIAAETGETRRSDEGVEAAIVPAAEPPPSQSSTASAPAPEPEAIENAPRRRGRGEPLAVSPYLRATGRIGWGLTPLVDGGGGLAFGVQWKRLRVETYGDVLAPSEKAVPGEPDARVRAFAWTVGLRGCGIAWASRAERVAIPVCGGAETGQLVGRGVGPGLARSDDHADLFVAVHAGPAVLARLARWASLYAGLDGFVLALRPGFRIVGFDRAVHRPAPAGVRVTLGIELHFPRRIRSGAGIR